MAEAKKPDETEVTWLDHPQTIDGNVWLPGHGSQHPTYMLVGEKPDFRSLQNRRAFSDDSTNLLLKVGSAAGFKFDDVYCTYAVKYMPPNKKAINSGDIRRCQAFLREEIRRLQPKFIISLGAPALKSLLGRNYGLSENRGTWVPFPETDIKVFVTINPSAILHAPQLEESFKRDWDTLAAHQGSAVAVEVPKTNYDVLTCAKDVELLADSWLKQPHVNLCLDAEWEGETWMHKDRYIRTLQLGYDHHNAMILEFTGVGGRPVIQDAARAWRAVKRLLEAPATAITGQNSIADGEWLLTYDVDIRSHVIFDTMLAEHLINPLGPFGLEELTTKYTPFGRYDTLLGRWVKEHPTETFHGYGMVPRELLLPYGALDVIVPRWIIDKQWPSLLAEGFCNPRGPYPSLWETVLITQRLVYDLELNGMLVDRSRLLELRKIYQEKSVHLQTLVVAMAAQIGIPDFNPRSTQQVQKLLFDTLQLQPIKTTGGKNWGLLLDKAPEVQAQYAPSTDKTTLEILEDAHPIVKVLSNLRKIDTTIKTFLREDPDADCSTTGGGLESKIWPDGRLHPRFSPLSDTGRFRTSKPNCQNFPKRAEKYMMDIFGGPDKVPPNVRTVVVPPPGWVLMEGDFVQAELFVLARLSNDRNMIAALTTPGKDLHDQTAVSAFKLSMVDSAGQTVTEDQLIALARKDMKAFEKFIAQVVYIDLRGKRLTRDEFKNGLRISAKTLNFGT